MKLTDRMHRLLLGIGVGIVGISIVVAGCGEGEAGFNDNQSRFFDVSPATVTATIGQSVQFTLREIDKGGAFIGNIPADQATFAIVSGALTGVATIDKQGLATCTATSAGGTVSVAAAFNATGTIASASLTCSPPLVPAISVSPKVATLRPGGTTQLAAAVTNSTSSVTWLSKTPATATASASGSPTTVTGVAVGQSYVVGILTTGTTTLRDSALVTVRNFRISPATASAASGASQQFTLQELDASGTPTGSTATSDQVTWTSVTTTVATIDAQGKATCASTGTGGTTTITGTFTPTAQPLSATLTCAGTLAPTITVSPKSVTVGVGQSATISATVANATGTGTVTWSSSDANVQVTASGSSAVVKGLGVTGPTPYNLVATYQQGSVTVKDIALVTVTAASSAGKVVGIAIEPRDAEMTAPSTLQFHAFLYDAAGNTVAAETGGEIRYTSSVAAAATIDAAGKASGKSAGSTQTTQITASYFLSNVSVVSATTPLIVYPPTAGHAGSIEISTGGDARSLKVGATLLFQVIVRDSNGNQIVGGETPVVTSSNPSALVITRDASPDGFFFLMKAVTPVPLPGVALKADITGAAATINMVIVP